MSKKEGGSKTGPKEGSKKETKDSGKEKSSSSKGAPAPSKSVVPQSKKERRDAAKREENEESAAASGIAVGGGKNQLVEMFQKKNCGWPEYVWLKGTAYDSVVGKSGKKAGRNMNMDIRVPNFDLHIGKGQLLLDNAELNISYGTRYGIIGRNGIGKSVLLRAISGREGPFSCIPTWYSILHVEQEIVGDERSPLEVVLASDRERLWLMEEAKRLEAEAEKKDAAQAPEDDSDEGEEDFQHYGLKDIYERLREIEAHKAESRASAILSGLQFDDQEMRHKPSKEYSGGWRMRISLARALFMTPELLILDEPSNHLDLSAAVWLEHYLSSYKKTLLLVSHDESMLNECVDSIIHFFNHKLHRYRGNYSTYLTVRDQNMAADVKKQHAQDVKIKKDRKAAQKNAGGKLGARKKNDMEKTMKERVEIVMDEKAPHFKFPDVGSVQDTAVLKFDEVTYGYAEGKPVVKNLSFGIYMDSRIALVGANGTGKSTIMKLMSGELQPDSGAVQGSSHLRVVKYDQHAEEKLDLEATCVEWLQRNSKDFVGGEPEYRKFLGKFGLHGQLALQKIGTLSGGQKARLVFATLASQGPHLMLLDEPSNHLDIFAIAALTEGLQNYGGGLVIISHNTKILSQCCNQTWVVHDHTVTMHEGSFDDYKQSIVATLMSAHDDSSDDERSAPPTSKKEKAAAAAAATAAAATASASGEKSKKNKGGASGKKDKSPKQ